MIAVVDSGSGNLRSVRRALERAGAPSVVVTADPDEVRRADRVVVPGQGAFKDGIDNLISRHLDEAIREVIAAGKPYLGLCVGMQLLFDESEEHGPVRGLGLLRGRVVRFAERPGLKVPHMGWNDVHLVKDDPLWRGIADGAYAYFVHSYHVVPDGPITCLETDYGGRFCAAIRHENVFACQFHPEKSQAVGLAFLENFVKA